MSFVKSAKRRWARSPDHAPASRSGDRDEHPRARRAMLRARRGV